MIIVYHINNKISGIVTLDHQKIEFDAADTIPEGMLKLAVKFPDQKIAWCHDAYRTDLSITELDSLLPHPKMMLSYNPNETIFFDDAIGYVEKAFVIKKNISYSAWQMSSVAGLLHATLLLELKDKIKLERDFDYYLSSVAMLGMPQGLLCYSEPKLLKQHVNRYSPKASLNTLFRFVKQHHKSRWVLLLFFNLIIYERKFPIWALIHAMFYKNRVRLHLNLDAIKIKLGETTNKEIVDVVIPTIGRRNPLYDFLLDLKEQTHLPENVIIVEQNPLENSVSELDYLTSESWPFNIKHTFTHQPGVCNARNIALDQVTGEWVFFADDDIRIENDFIAKTLENIKNVGAKAVSIACLQKGEKPKYDHVFQWIGFGSGCSFVAAENVKNCRFSLGFEFGFGEDGDYGMQLRNQGCDVLYLPEPQIKHLKAPVGGFRIKPVLKWHHEPVQPKPSPTVMLFLILYRTKQQLLGYKTTLFFKYYRAQKIKNPFQYYKTFQKQWDRSWHWANEIKNNSLS